MIDQQPRNSLTGWLFSADQIRRATANGDMLNPSIDLTNACNLNCAYCYVEEKNSRRKARRADELSLQETLELLRDLSSCGAKTINIVGAGEPTIDPHFTRVIDAIADLDMIPVVFTNGILLASRYSLCGFLYSRNASVVLKYNSISPAKQDAVAGRKHYSTKRDQALSNLLEVGFASSMPTRLGIDIIVFRGNLCEIPQIHSNCRQQNIFPIAAEFIPTGRTDGGTFHGQSALLGLSTEASSLASRLLQPISDEERLGLLAELASIDATYGIGRPPAFAYFGGAICTQLLGLYIDIGGDIWPCVARKKKILSGPGFTAGLLGNFRRGDRPSEIWRRNAYIRRLREHFTGACPYKAPLALAG